MRGIRRARRLWDEVTEVGGSQAAALVPADSLQLASMAHAVPQADETLSEALVYGVTVAWALSCCCQGRYKDRRGGWKMVDRMSQPPPTPRGLFTLVCSGDVTQRERGALGKCGAYLGIICFVSLLEGTRQDTCGGSREAE